MHFRNRPLPRCTDRVAYLRAPQRGFTIIELLITVTIGAILAAIAVPALRDTLNTTRQSAALGLIVNDLNQARGEAIKRNARMLMCARSDTATNATSCGTNWTRGWLVCIEAAAPDTCMAATLLVPNPVLVVRPPLDANLTLTGSGAAVRFNPNSSAVAGTLTLGGNWSGATSRVVSVAATGNITK